MIPILYEKDETQFISNGLGRLRDVISCVCVEERNGLYEVNLEMPVNGQNFGKMVYGRIIAVTHDESGDVQPFVIVSSEKPINGIVSFRAVHISYRQTALTVTGENINSLADALELMSTSTPANPFSYWTDKESSNFMAAADGIPHSVRQMLGGMEGSILDAYGGEFEWDKWTVKLHSARGSEKPFTIRYGVNLVDYKEQIDFSDTYTSVIPYWKGQNKKGKDIVVEGDEVSVSYQPFDGYDRCIPLDLTDKFKDKPSKSELEAEAENYLKENQPYLPAQSLEVDFVRITDTPEYVQFASLQKCKLCDTINVEFPMYKMSGRFKIVKTEYDVLQERYTKLELGTLTTTLAQSLGIGQSSASHLNAEGIPVELDDMVVVEYSHDYSAVSSGNSMQWEETKTKSGYYPIGVVGFRTGRSALCVTGCRIENATSGSCNLYFNARAVANASAATAYMKVLWIKET